VRGKLIFLAQTAERILAQQNRSVKTMAKSKVIEEGYELEVHECLACGFHTGLDATYLDQVGSLTVRCPGCGKTFHVNSFDEGENENG
jgi:hypothetical protein